MSLQHAITDLPLDHRKENEYPKLVRDKIPAIILQNDGFDVPTRTLAEDTEYLGYLLKKVVEEAAELSEATTDSNIVEEIADVYEVIDAILKLKGVENAEVVAVQDAKRKKRGGFDDRLLMLRKRP